MLFHGATHSRRQVLAWILGAGCVSRRLAAVAAPLRVALSESIVSGVNLNDARAATQVWIQQLSAELNMPVDISPKVFDSREEIVRRARAGLFDAVALTILEYRQIAEFLDPSLLLAEGGPQGQVQYLLLAKKNSGSIRLNDLRGRRLAVLDTTRMCVAQAWLSTLLAERHLPPGEQFFASMASEMKPSRVILPVFFGQVDACLTSKTTFDTMCELNPQVGKELVVVASSPPLVTAFCAFHRDYHGAGREKMARIYLKAPSTAAEQQLATLFEFRQLAPRDAAFLAPTLEILDGADRVRRERASGGRK